MDVNISISGLNDQQQIDLLKAILGTNLKNAGTNNIEEERSDLSIEDQGDTLGTEEDFGPQPEPDDIPFEIISEADIISESNELVN